MHSIYKFQTNHIATFNSFALKRKRKDTSVLCSRCTLNSKPVHCSVLLFFLCRPKSPKFGEIVRRAYASNVFPQRHLFLKSGGIILVCTPIKGLCSTTSTRQKITNTIISKLMMLPITEYGTDADTVYCCGCNENVTANVEGRCVRCGLRVS